MNILPVVTSSIDDINTFINLGDTTVDLLNHFDDPFTTGLVASFNLDSSTVNNNNPNYDLGSGITNVVLFDQEGQGAPLTVQNFLNYVSDGDYVNTIIHRSVPGFVIQGGGFTVEGLADVLNTNPASAIGVIPSDPPVVNEFSSDRSNLRGTIAMAKLGGDPDSATNQWFFNLGDNSANLDDQNGGFTVFGEVLEQSDLDILDAIASIDIFNDAPDINDPTKISVFGQGAFTNLPLIFDDPTNLLLTGDENFVHYSNITISQEPELSFTVVKNSNPSLVNPIINNNQLVLDYLPDQVGTAEITIRATDLTGDFVDDSFFVTVNEFDGTADFIRFQNANVPGTYLYAAGGEAQNIRNNFPGFVEEGVAFNAAIEPDDELIPLFRFQSNQLPGTYLFVGEEERNNINADPNFANAFTEEGIAFYVYGAGADKETAFSRFQNANVPGTYLYAAGGEAQNIRNNFPGFIDEGIAFEVSI